MTTCNWLRSQYFLSYCMYFLFLFYLFVFNNQVASSQSDFQKGAGHQIEYNLGYIITAITHNKIPWKAKIEQINTSLKSYA